ncbi:MAG: carboxypeptidase-like regulatory domain-containing protein, partial [Muribaculaceae bacterium]|nr:carboxypeptidase-like regulatory domain-containing protein [Muribaculaceae bacterium]
TVAAGRPVRFSSDALGDGGTVQFLLADAQGRILSSRLAFVYPREVPDSLIGPGDYAVSVTAADYAVPDTTNSIVAQLLLQSELNDYVEDAAYYFRRPDRTARADLDALLLTHEWKRYDIPAVIGGKITEPQMPMEIGGELSGMVKSRWRGKPLEGADVNVLAPSMEYAATVKTDAQGRFTVTGVDWPDGTAFVFQATGKKGDREHNFEVDRDRFPENNSVIIPRWKENNDADFGPISGYGTDVLLKEITVIGSKSEEEIQASMFKALGARSVDASYFEEHNITTYEEALRGIPGLVVQNGRVNYMGRRSSIYGVSNNVEFWVDGSRWLSAYEAIQPGLPSLQIHQMTGGMPKPTRLDYARNMGTPLQEFASIYPFQAIEKIDFLRPSVAMVISGSAAQAGGLLMMTTKKGGKGLDWYKDLFIQVMQPLGYQNAPDAYRTYKKVAEHEDDKCYEIWIPTVLNKPQLKDSQLTTEKGGKILLVSGITDDGTIVSYIDTK